VTLPTKYRSQHSRDLLQYCFYCIYAVVLRLLATWELLTQCTKRDISN